MNSIFPSNLKSISYLFEEKSQLLKSLINNLKPNDVKDGYYDQTLDRIKKEVLLTPVTIGEPKIIDHRSEVRQMPANYMNPFPHKKDVTTVSVQFPFEGSRELFSYSPSGYSYSSSSTGVYQPSSKDSILITVEVDALDKEVTLSKARQQMETTFSLIRQINPSAENWTKSQEPMIEEMLQNRKSELDNFYS